MKSNSCWSVDLAERRYPCKQTQLPDVVSALNETYPKFTYRGGYEFMYAKAGFLNKLSETDNPETR